MTQDRANVGSGEMLRVETPIVRYQPIGRRCVLAKAVFEVEYFAGCHHWIRTACDGTRERAFARPHPLFLGARSLQPLVATSGRSKSSLAVMMAIRAFGQLA
jgi:hypothetical protein